MIGRVVKGIGGFYFVSDGADVSMGTARGNLKRNKDTIYVGDLVDYDIAADGDCIIQAVHERKNFLTRPPVSNVDLMVIVFSAAFPKVNMLAVDKLAVGAEYKGIRVAICVTKPDIICDDIILRYEDIYSNIYPFFTVNGITGEGINELKKIMAGQNSVLAGASGVGKSTLTNLIAGGIVAETGAISDKSGRGRHTTRHVEIFELDNGGSIYDTPGFTAIDIKGIVEDELRSCFPEIRKLRSECRYDDCRHLKEPDCAVRQAVSEGKMPRSRYNSYVSIMEEIKSWQK